MCRVENKKFLDQVFTVGRHAERDTVFAM